MMEAQTLVESMGGSVKQAVKEYFTEMWLYFKTDLIDTSYLLVLLGGTICVILYVAGWEKGMRYLGIMFVGYILLRAVLG